jgi:MFS family permease
MADPIATPGRPARARSWLSRNVILLGMISLLNDTASEAIIPLLPVFLLGMGAGAFALGWIEGVAEAVSAVLKLVAGRAADKVGRNRPFVVFGYSLSAVVKPLIALATSPWHILAVRSADRVGKGFRSGPRDALLSASVDSSQRGAAFSLHRAMDHAGAVLGPLLAAAFLLWISDDLPTLFWLTAIPGVLVMALVWFGVKEEPTPPPEPKTQPAPPRQGLLRFLLPLGLFTLGNSSDVFLLMKAAGDNPDPWMFPLLWVGLHIVKMLASVPGGKISDRWGRRRTIAVGWLLYAAIYAALAFAENEYLIWALLGAYGLYYGLTEGPERALISEIAPKRKQGAAFGWYYLTLGLLALAASAMFGTIWEFVSSRAAFLTGAGLALAAVIALGLLWRSPTGARD